MHNRGFEKILVLFLVASCIGVGAYLQKPDEKAKPNGTQITFLNVGQGDATLVTTPNGKNVLIDGGPDKKVLSELGEVLSPSQHMIDVVVLSHPHADHVAGLDYVLDRYQVGEVYLTGSIHNSPEYLEFLSIIKNQNILAKKAYRNQKFEIDGVKFTFLLPNTDISGQTLVDQNDGSAVLDISYANFHTLMLGDLSAKLQEKYLLADGALGKAEIIKISHHGSKTGTSSKVVLKTTPKFAAILVGKNRFGHPAPFTLSQLAGVKTLRTDQNGRVIFRISADGVEFQ